MTSAADFNKAVQQYTASRGFPLRKAVEIARGLLATQDGDGEHGLYMDLTEYTSEGRVYPEESLRKPALPPGMGLMEMLTAPDIEVVIQGAKMLVVRRDGSPVEWHRKPRTIV